MKNTKCGHLLLFLLIFAVILAFKPINAQAASIVNQNGEVFNNRDDNNSSKVKLSSPSIKNLSSINIAEVSSEQSYAWPDVFSSNADTVPFMGFYLKDENYDSVTGIVVDKIEIYQQENLILSTTNVTSYSKVGKYFISDANFKSKLSDNNGDNKVNVIFYRSGVEVARLSDFILKSYSIPIISEVFPNTVGTNRNEFPLEVSILNASKNATINAYYTNSNGDKVATLVGENKTSRRYDSETKELTVKLKMVKNSDFDNSDSYNEYTAHIFVDNSEITYCEDYNSNLYVNSNPEVERIYHVTKSPYHYHIEGINLVNADSLTLKLEQNDTVIAEISDIKAKFDSSTYFEYIDEDITKKIKNPKVEMRATLYSNDTELSSFTFFETPDSPDLSRELTKMKFDTSKTSLETRGTFQLKLVGTYSDNSTDDITNTATYSSSKDSIASVDKYGLITANGIGTAVITASSEDGSKKTTFNVTVTPKLTGLTTSTETISVEIGKKVTVKATAVYEDGKTKDVSKDATWTIKDNSDIIAISNGVVSGVTSGEAVLVISYGELTKEVSVSVTKVLTGLTAIKPIYNLKTGETEENTIMATYSDSTQEDVTKLCAWKSNNTTIADVNGNGIVTAGTRGKAVVTASLGKFKANVNVVVDPVLESISITPDSSAIYLGKTQKLKVFATYLGENDKKYDITNSISNDEWSKNDNDIITVSKGVVKANAVGNTTVTISYQGKTAVTNITAKKSLKKLSANPVSIRSDAGETISVDITAKFSVGEDEIVTDQCTWSSSNKSVADIDSENVIHSFAKGKTKITAEWQGKKVTITVTVK